MQPDWLFRNPASNKQRPYGAAQRSVLNLAGLEAVEAALTQCPRHAPTPLHALPGLARELGIGQIFYKDEGERFGFGAFKALGGVYAVGRQLQKIVRERTGATPGFADLVSRTHADLLAGITVTAASSGNHGRAVAAGARLFGCRCTILLPAFASTEKEAMIRRRGAEILRIDGGYDQALEECRRLAREQQWLLVSDTSWDGYAEIPRDVMQAYGVIAGEALRQTAALPGAPALTHVMLQAGVGGLAAGIAGTLWESRGAERPDIIVVEPQSADCFLQTARAGRPTEASGDAATIMGGLACREISPDAWVVLQHAAEWFCAVPEAGVPDSLRTLALPRNGDRPIAAGPSGSAGLQGLMRMAQDSSARGAAGLDNQAVVLLIGSENAVGEPDYFRACVGSDAAAIAALGAAWDATRR